LIYRPDKKPDYYLPIKKEVRETTAKDSSKNDSINASNIISSLVEANKNKLLTQRFNRKPQNGNFDKAEDFKLFPKKLNSSIHESDSVNKSINLANKTSPNEEQSFDSKRNSFTGSEIKKIGNYQGLNYSAELQNSEPVNKKRQELSEQLKQISVKIDR
jgi:hypothetical protein